ncbi:MULTISPECIES: class I SAM-dependent methyltransferase [Pseudomonas]|uniref:class I SAM-dependent methyltransferase n=1 Tax=Pseudomonas nitroreducens TaxID=46680 RepID=UPI00147C3053|nr:MULTISPECIES: class I SAM-dependent methyltransferase [Pseudomonas]NNN23771.1 class I SAM-dependent methyltransferase [Pseudomonas nitroreducens]
MAVIAQACVCCGATALERSPAILMPFVAHRVFGWTPVEITEAWGLRDLAPGHAYALCNTLHCPACDLTFLDLRFDGEELGRLYHDYRGDGYTQLRDHYEPGYARRNQHLLQGGGYAAQVEAFLAPLLPAPQRVLDWGGDSGINTPFRGRLSQHHVLEISDRPLVDGAQRVDAHQAREHHYQLVVLSQVLEHVPEPLALLDAVTGVLASDSLLYIEVPYEGLVQQIAAGNAHWQDKRHWHEHINFYAEASLRALVARAGLVVERLGSLEVDVGNGPVRVFSLVCRLATA